jgi:hypothetical protein
MAKVFRFHDGDNNVEDWKPTRGYDDTAITDIKDPDGATAKKQITSIPSPFARIDLVQTAFKIVADSRDLDGKTIYHKMISDSFDVGEIFFDYTRLSPMVEIIAWDRENDLNTLLNSTNSKHKLLGKTLELYLNQDADSYNFDLLKRIYLLNYKEGPDKINIIGGTSPCSLFFSSANDLSYAQEIKFGANTAFDGNHQPLYKRDIEYVKYLFYLQTIIPDFEQRFKYVHQYLELTYRQLVQAKKDSVRNLTKDGYDTDFQELYVNNANDLVEINGEPLRKKKPDTSQIENNSDFVIKPTKTYSKTKPIVFPSSPADYGMIYTTDKWDKNYLPVYEEQESSLDKRKLPHTMEPYPFLTISDFLEPTIIRTVFPINEKFYNGNLQESEKFTKGYILPLKKEFFQFFSIEDLKGTTDGKKMFQISNRLNESVRVTLRIPIRGKKEAIIYERIYYHDARPDISKNKGAVLDNQFNLLLYPFFKITGIDNHYRIGVIDRDILPSTMKNEYSLQFFSQDSTEPIKVSEDKIRTRSQKKQQDGFSSKYYILNKNFDYIQVQNEQSTGIIVPDFPERSQGNLKFTFAIDFGTTNTHIEYTQDGGNPQPLEITEKDIQLETLHDRKFYEKDPSLNGTGATDLVSAIDDEFLPIFIGKNCEYKFPTRTAISFKQNIDYDRPAYALADFNLSFRYEKYRTPPNTEICANLKWDNYTGEENNQAMVRIKKYFENLMLLVRNKILLNNGNLARTEFVWFYPVSMETYRIRQLEKEWNEIYNKYIIEPKEPENSKQALKLSESIAPFYYFNKKWGVTAAGRPVVSMDIGGGTTDIVVYTNNDTPSIQTSVRFAANDIFGDGFNGSSNINGFINTFKDKIYDKLSANADKLSELKQVFDELIEKEISRDIVAFFFSIENNRKVKDIPLSFNSMLAKNEDLKIIFILFYSSLIYHIAKIMKLKGLESPRYITFSGTGSKVINIADGSLRLDTLSELTSIIFRKVMKKDCGTIELHSYSAPKEMTCKGGLKIPLQQNIGGETIDITTNEGKRKYEKYIDSIKVTLLGDAGDTMMTSQNPLKYSTALYGAQSEKGQQLVKSEDSPERKKLESGIIEEYGKFIELFFSIYKEDYRILKNLGASENLQTAKEILQNNDDVSMYLRVGINKKLEYLRNNTEDEIEESFFFYPLIGGINKLAFEIYKMKNK